ncbi:MAG: J domain-containing protein [Spirochaetes bacterium]|nr:J domain-containing protein [Spirochaetota bacterium]
MEYKDYYKILGVEKAVGKDELKKQYRKLARRYHPDVNKTDKDAAAKFSDISEAYNVLIDDDKRGKYDTLGMDWEQHQNAGQADGFDWSKYASPGNGKEGERTARWEDLFGMGSGTSDFFKTIFGQEFRGREGTQFARKGQDLSAELTLSLKDAYEGGTKIISVGANKIRIKLLPGIWDRQRIKIDGKGLPGSKGADNGDLFITFLLKPDPEYRLDGVDLFKDIPLSIYSALLGTNLVVQTISGKFELKVPPETKNGTVFRLKGRGFPVYGKSGSHGDLFLKIALKLPENLTEREKALFRELAGIRQEQVGGGVK